MYIVYPYMSTARTVRWHSRLERQSSKREVVGSIFNFVILAFFACLTRTRQIIRFRATATLRRPHIKQYTVSNEGGGATKPTGTSYMTNMKRYFYLDVYTILNRNELTIWTICAKYEAMHPTVVSENNFLSGMLKDQAQDRTSSRRSLGHSNEKITVWLSYCEWN